MTATRSRPSLGSTPTSSSPNAYPLISEHWDKLNAIAPVVGHVEAPGVDTWQQGVEQVGLALGRSEKVKQRIAQVEEAIAAARTARPAFAGKRVSFSASPPVAST